MDQAPRSRFPFPPSARHDRPPWTPRRRSPELRRLPPGETFRAYHVSDTAWSFDEYDVANQGLISHHFESVDGRVRRVSVPFRYAWPAELDLMARLAGMRLRERWEWWDRTPYSSESESHVSVWEKE